MKTRILMFAFIIASFFSFTPNFNEAKASPVTDIKKVTAVTIPVTGTFPGGTFAGAYEITRFVIRQGQIFAAGTLTGTLTGATGVIGNITRNVLIPVDLIPQAACTILELDLGPLDLNLLGLMVHLDEVHLLIEAVPGAGLLGDLLCAIANLLNNDGPLGQIAVLLNRVLALAPLPIQII